MGKATQRPISSLVYQFKGTSPYGIAIPSPPYKEWWRKERQQNHDSNIEQQRNPAKVKLKRGKKIKIKTL